MGKSWPVDSPNLTMTPSFFCNPELARVVYTAQFHFPQNFGYFKICISIFSKYILYKITAVLGK